MNGSGQSDIDLYDQLVQERSTLTSTYSELSRFIWPDHSVFYRPQDNREGEKRAQEVVDTTACVAADRAASALMSMTAPTHKQYHRLSVDDDELGEDTAVMQWLEEATEAIFRHRYAPKTGFAAQYHECCKSAIVFGPMITYLEDLPGSGFRYHAWSLSNTFLTEDAFGRINGAVRSIKLTTSQMVDKFGLDNLPDKIRDAFNSGRADRKREMWEVIHTIQPLPSTAPVTEWKYSSRYVCRDQSYLLQESGFRTLPIAASRSATMPAEVYGRSISMTVLPTIKSLNVMVRDFIKGVHKQVDPPLLAFDEDGVLTAIKALPGRVTPGGVNSDGKPLVMPLSQPGRLDWANEMITSTRRQVEDAYMVTLFQILSADQRPQQTAYEVSVREMEKSALLSPMTDRIVDEYFGTLVPRELSLLMEAGYLPPMPPALEGRIDQIKIMHTGEISRAQQADEMIGFQRAMEMAPALAQLDPSAVKKIKWDEGYGKFAIAAGMSAELLRTEDEMEEIKATDDQQMQAMAASQAAPDAARAAKDFATAEQIRSGQANLLGGYPPG